MNTTSLWLTLLMFGGNDLPDPPKKASPLVGEWQAELIVEEGKRSIKEYTDLSRWRFSETHLFQPVIGTYRVDGKIQKTWLSRERVAVYTLDSLDNPKTITLRRGLLPPKLLRGIWRLENDQLFIYGGDVGLPRPKEFPKDEKAIPAGYSLLRFKRIVNK